MRPDPLAGLSLHARRIAEQEAARYIKAHGQNYADPQAIARQSNIFAGAAELGSADMQPFPPGQPLDGVICARVDLDHPIYFADNRITRCGDCGCDIQHRPDVPEGPPKLCLCCWARREAKP